MTIVAVGGDGGIGGVHVKLSINSCLVQEDMSVSRRHGAALGGEMKVFAAPVIDAFLHFLHFLFQNFPCFLHLLSSHPPLLPLG